MSVPAASVGGRRGGSLMIPVLIACVALAVLLLLPRLSQSEAPATSPVRTDAANGTARSGWARRITVRDSRMLTFAN